jgi:hypothetical protein
MSVRYNSKSIIPAPLVTVERRVDRRGDGTIRRKYYQITARGSLVAFAGSPDATGSFWTLPGYPPDAVVGPDSRLGALIAKQGALCRLFCDAGQWFEAQSADGTAPLKFQPRLASVTFDEGQWYDRVPYTVTMEADTVYFGNVECCTGDATVAATVDETWAVEAADENQRTWRITHTATASSTRRHNADGSVAAEGWERARDAVLAALGYSAGMVFQAGVPDSAAQPYDHARTVSIDEAEGRYAVTETWLAFDPASGPDAYGAGVPAIEEFSCETRVADNGRVSVRVQGSVRGLLSRAGDFTIAATRWERAQAKWAAVAPNLLARAQNYSGVSLNPTPASATRGDNPIGGTITYDYEYDNRCSPAIAGARSQVVTVTDRNPADVFARLTVLGRPAGPVLQSIGTVTERVRTVNVEVVMPPRSYGNCGDGASPRPDVSAIILAQAPTALQVFVETDEETWSEDTGRFSRTVSFVYQ